MESTLECNSIKEGPPSSEESLLEPDDWANFREEAHQTLDVALDFAQ